ncbi:hypothetical protein DL770_009677 [Monosporascus sp. CRB-9-2]|nr:hypothetical protein DL770_009677 [Monosporascus sp. CRB-9-2]
MKTLRLDGGREFGIGVKNKDDNVVSEDDTDQETKQVKPLTQKGEDGNGGLHIFHFVPDVDDNDFFGGHGDADQAIRNIYEYQQMVNMLKDKYDSIFKFENLENINPGKLFTTYRLFAVMDDGPSLKEAIKGPERKI